MASTDLTHQQEKFVLARFLGKTQRQAYYEAYPTSKTWRTSSVDVKASELANNGKVMVRLKELREEVVDDVKYTRDWLLKRFEEIYNKSFMETPVLDSDGEPTGEYRFDSTGANKALTEIGKLQGFYIQQVQVSGELDLKAIALKRYEMEQAKKLVG